MSPTKGLVDVQVIGDTESVERMMARVQKNLSFVGLELFLNTIVEPWMQNRAADRFQNEGDDAVGKWADLKPTTALIRSQAGFGADHPINVRTGELEAYITGSNATVGAITSGAQLVYPGDKATGELGDKVLTAQSGRAYPSTVARPVLGMNETDLIFVLDELSTFIQRP